jgi:outer membrane protein assembly factor BamB
LCAYHPADGAERWCYQLTGTIRRNSATLDVNGHLYIGARDNRLYALDSNDEGREVWSFKIQNDGDVNTSPVISPTDGTVYVVATFNGWAHALSPTGPPPIWSLVSGGFVAYSSPALGADGTIYFGTSRGYLRALTPAGTLRWEVKVGRYIRDTSPVIATNGTIYIGSADGVTAVDPDGNILWTFATNGRVRSTPALDPAGRLYVGSVGQGPSLRATFYAINPNGTERWSYVPAAVRSRFFSSPAIGADGTIYTTSGSTIVALDSQDGSVEWEFETGKKGSIISSPAIGADGTLYIGADKLYAFGE